MVPRCRALGGEPVEDLDAFQIGRIDVEVAVRQLARLIIQINCHVGKQSRRTAPLARLHAGTQTVHEYLVLAGAVARRGNVREILEVVLERRHIEFLQCLSREGWIEIGTSCRLSERRWAVTVIV
ncbi:MAG: hypothetical protein NVSMB10_11820 [Steroidobacteraceae bacterium]